MRTPPLILALQEPDIDTKVEEILSPTRTARNMKLQPNIQMPDGLPPVIVGKDRDVLLANRTNGSIFSTITETFVPVTDDSENVELENGVISTIEPRFEDETTEITESVIDHTMKIEDVREVESATLNDMDSNIYNSEYSEPETSTLDAITDYVDSEWSDINGTGTNDYSDDSFTTVTNDYIDESLTTITAVEFEIPTERTLLTIENTEMYEKNIITNTGEMEISTNIDLSTVTETPTNTLDLTQTPISKSADVLDVVTDKNILLEASPTTGVVDVTDVPLTDPSKFDFKIVTTRKGLQVDAHDTVFDPTQIAKATSYEGSSYSTATRSATVTTWVDPNERNLTTQKPSNSSTSYISENPTHILPSGLEESSSISPSHTVSEVSEDNLPHKISEELLEHEVTTANGDSNELITENPFANTPEISTYYVDLKDKQNTNEEINLKEREGVSLSKNNTKISGDIAYNFTGGMENLPTEKLSDLSSIARNQTNALYELPGSNMHNNSDLNFSTSVIIALSVCCSIALLAGLITLTLWLCRRHRTRSKIYLSREAAKPRAFFTKPMNPALLPDESFEEPRYVLEFQRPRAPVVLGNEQKDFVFKPKNSDDLGLGLENDGFTDIPLEELKIEGYKKHKRPSQDPPKYGPKAKIESDTDSGIRVWSSTGSLYTASPQLTHCSVPPPPYSPSIGEEPACLSVHALPPLSKKVGSIDL